MKKILRLVTTSVLTLTLVACGGQSSASSQPSTQSSSTGTTSSSSAYAAVSVISISADSSSLTQVSGATKKVTVTAKFDSAADPATKLEWYVNSVKDSQTGKTFDYTPSAEGEYKIVAKVGSVASNEILVKVSQAGVAPSEFAVKEPKVIDADTIEIEGDSGASVVVKGHDLKDTSRYSLSEGKYIIELAKVLAQGEDVQITLKKGDKEVVKSFVYDLQKVEVASVGAVKAVDGVYTITKPFNTDLSNAEETTYEIKWATDEFVGNYATEFSATVPAGAAAISSSTGPRSYQDGDNLVYNLKVNKDTVSGTYAFKYKVGAKEAVATIVVVDPEAELVISKQAAKDADGATKQYDVALGTNAIDAAAQVFNINVANGKGGLTASADGSFKIEKPYLASASGDVAGASGAFQVKFSADNIAIPAVMNTAANTAKPNRVQLSVVGPDGIAVFRLATGSTQIVNSVVTTMRDETEQDVVYAAKFDSTTPAGDYTITASVYTSEAVAPVLTKSVVIKLVEPQASLSLDPVQLNDASGNKGQKLVQDATDKSLYTIAQPRVAGNNAQQLIFNAVLKNYESARTLSADIANSFNNGTTNKDFLVYKTSATGPQTIEGYDVNSKIGVELDVAANTEYSNIWSATKSADYDYGVIVYYQPTGKFYTSSAADNAAVPVGDDLVTLGANWALTSAIDAANEIIYENGVAYAAPTVVAGDTVVNSGLKAATLGIAAWDSEKADYASGALVSYEGKIYTTTVANTTKNPTATPTDWTKLDAKSGDVLDTAMVVDGAATTTLAVGARFVHEGLVYRVTTALVATDSWDTILADKAVLNTPKTTIKIGANGNAVANRGVGAAAATYKYYSSLDGSIDLYNVFALKVDNLTSTGDYKYSIQIGDLTKDVTIRVIKAEPKLEFKLASLEDKDSAAALVATKFAAMQATNEYEIVLDAAKKPYKSALSFVIENMDVPASNQLAYEVEIVTPSVYNRRTDVFGVVDTGTSDGHLKSNTSALENVIYDLDGGTDAAVFEIKEVGDYSIKLTIGSLTKTIVIHAVKDASLEIESVYNNKTRLFLEEAKGTFLVSEAAAAQEYPLSIAVVGNNLPSTVYYKVWEDAACELTPAGDFTVPGDGAKLDTAKGIDIPWTVSVANSDISLYIRLYSDKAATKPIGTITKVSLFDLYN